MYSNGNQPHHRRITGSRPRSIGGSRHEIEWTAAYTWSHATDTASDFDEQPQNPYALADELAVSRYDQPHRFVASALVDLPIGGGLRVLKHPKAIWRNPCCVVG